MLRRKYFKGLHMSHGHIHNTWKTAKMSRSSVYKPIHTHTLTDTLAPAHSHTHFIWSTTHGNPSALPRWRERHYFWRIITCPNNRVHASPVTHPALAASPLGLGWRKCVWGRCRHPLGFWRAHSWCCHTDSTRKKKVWGSREEKSLTRRETPGVLKPYWPWAGPRVSLLHRWFLGSWRWNVPPQAFPSHSDCGGWCLAWWWQMTGCNRCL